MQLKLKNLLQFQYHLQYLPEIKVIRNIKMALIKNTHPCCICKKYNAITYQYSEVRFQCLSLMKFVQEMDTKQRDLKGMRLYLLLGIFLQCWLHVLICPFWFPWWHLWGILEFDFVPIEQGNKRMVRIQILRCLQIINHVVT